MVASPKVHTRYTVNKEKGQLFEVDELHLFNSLKPPDTPSSLNIYHYDDYTDSHSS